MLYLLSVEMITMLLSIPFLRWYWIGEAEGIVPKPFGRLTTILILLIQLRLIGLMLNALGWLQSTP